MKSLQARGFVAGIISSTGGIDNDTHLLSCLIREKINYLLKESVDQQQHQDLQ